MEWIFSHFLVTSFISRHFDKFNKNFIMAISISHSHYQQQQQKHYHKSPSSYQIFSYFIDFSTLHSTQLSALRSVNPFFSQSFILCLQSSREVRQLSTRRTRLGRFGLTLTSNYNNKYYIVSSVVQIISIKKTCLEGDDDNFISFLVILLTSLRDSSWMRELCLLSLFKLLSSSSSSL